jgi:hypothetical protein
MPTIQQLLESQEKEFNENIGQYTRVVQIKQTQEDIDKNLPPMFTDITNEIFDWHKQSIIALYEMELANIEMILAKYENENNSYAPFAKLRKDLQDKKTHYKQVIEELRK